MFRMIRSEVETITPETAGQLLALNPLERQRIIRPWHVDHLGEKMIDGRFRTGSIGIARVRNGNGETKEFMVNGHHTTRASVKYDQTFRATVEVFECTTMDDVGLLYDQFDVHLPRSLRDLLRFEMVVLNLTWPVHFVQLLVVGAAKREGMDAAPKGEKKKLLRRYLDQGRLLLEIVGEPGGIIQTDHARHLMRGPVFDAMLRTIEKSVDDSRRFWVAVRDGENLTRNRPEYRLREFLQGATFYKGRTSPHGSAAGIVSAHEMTARCIVGWNAFRRGKVTNLAYRREKPIPAAV